MSSPSHSISSQAAAAAMATVFSPQAQAQILGGNLSTPSTSQGVPQFVPNPQYRPTAQFVVNTETASMNVLLRASVPVANFCSIRNYHHDTMRVASQPGMIDASLKQISDMCANAQRQAEEMQKFHASQLVLRPPVPSSSLPLAPGVFTVPTATVPRPPAPVTITRIPRPTATNSKAPVVSQEPTTETIESDNDTGDDTFPYDANGSSDSVQIIDPNNDVDVVPLRELQAPKLSFDQSFDAPSLDDNAPASNPALRNMFKFIGDTVTDVDAVPVPIPRSNGIRSGLQAPRQDSDMLCLTTSACTRQCLEERQQELKKTEIRGQSKDFLRVTRSEVLKVKTTAYTPGDSTWSLSAPPLPPNCHPGLPTIARNHQWYAIAYNDVYSLESTARTGLKTAGDAESALIALTSFLAPIAHEPMVHQLHQFVAGSLRDSISCSLPLAPAFIKSDETWRCQN